MNAGSLSFCATYSNPATYIMRVSLDIVVELCNKSRDYSQINRSTRKIVNEHDLLVNSKLEKYLLQISTHINYRERVKLAYHYIQKFT